MSSEKQKYVKLLFFVYLTFGLKTIHYLSVVVVGAAEILIHFRNSV